MSLEVELLCVGGHASNESKIDDSTAPDAGVEFLTLGRGGPSKESKIDEVIAPEDGAGALGLDGGPSNESKMEDDIAPEPGAEACGFEGGPSKESKIELFVVFFGGTSYALNIDEVDGFPSPCFDVTTAFGF